MSEQIVVLCPGQGAQKVGMGRVWHSLNDVAKATFEEADEVLGDQLGAPLSRLCFDGPDDRLNETDVAQPALYTCGVASFRAMRDHALPGELSAAAGLSLGEYTALHIAGVFDFATGLQLVATRGRLMQEAAIASKGGMVALIGADDDQAQAVCDEAAEGGVLVPANYNAPGQIVISGDQDACERAVEVATRHGLTAKPLTVAGAFHSPHMQAAADQMRLALAEIPLQKPNITVWSNVTARPHDSENMELLRQRLVEQIVSPVRWAQSCAAMPPDGTMSYHELAPGKVLKGLMRRINKQIKVESHDEP
jgi:[acyl-carrier-protein] S-malonyltransferase